MGPSPSKVMPPTAEFERVHAREPGEKLLGEGTDAVPSDKHGNPIKVTMDESWLAKVHRTDGGGEYAGGLQIKRYARKSRRRLELLDGRGNTLAVCLEMHGTIRKPPSFKVYGTRPIIEGQEPSRKRKQKDGGPLFVWAAIADLSQNHKFEITIGPDAGRSRNDGQRTPTYKSEEVAGRDGPRVVIWKEDKPAVAVNRKRVATHSSDHQTEVTIAPGVDPCLALCFVAVMGDRERSREEASSCSLCFSAIPLVPF